ncbi:ATP-binding protein [Marinobacter xestospongiae]|uniref:ATP-binding protein n=1 Tax=Marinobacter xestospongiae TaxID=994319 RepID=UPI002006609E|nr:ATP-binding protein [Marinobacter xestospongiae]MCK7566363.1 ATP-binding protein [Marinobacter xestospongiae]
MSLTRTLTLLILATVLVIAGLAAIWSYVESNHELEELFDAELAQSTRIVQGLVRHLVQSQSLASMQQILEDTLALPPGARQEGDFEEILPDGSGHKYEKKIAFQIWSADGELYLSTQLHDTGFSPRPGYAWAESQGFAWRTFTLQDPATGVWIRAAQRNDIRQELSEELAVSNVLPLLVALPLLAIALVLAIRLGLRPLRRLATPLRHMAPERLHPLDEHAAPKEVQALVQAINGLLQRLDDALDRERRFSADAAHELRTPLAALRLNLEKVSAEAPEKYDGLIRSVDRMSHLVEQMLLLNRVDHDAALERQPVNLAELVADELAGIAPLAMARGITPVLDSGDQPSWCHGNPVLLGTLIRSLLANAVQYSPAATELQASIRHDHNQLVLRLCDQGPGIAPEQRQRALSRFVRLDQRQGTGAGLGLAIAQRIVDRHGGQLMLSDRDDGQSGLCVQISLPAEPDPAAICR